MRFSFLPIIFLFFPLSSFSQIKILYVPGEASYTGEHVKNGESWNGLFCIEEKCLVKSVKLQAKPTTIPGYDGDEKGQSITIPNKESSELLFQGLPKIKPGKVTTFYNSQMGEPSRPNTSGEYEIELKKIAGGDIKIIPTLTKDSKIKYFLYQGKKKQLLKELDIDSVVGAAGLPKGSNLLIWAGDLDGDKKIDLILSLDNRTGEAVSRVLFLSGLAKENEIVGEAGVFYFWPPGNPGC